MRDNNNKPKQLTISTLLVMAFPENYGIDNMALIPKFCNNYMITKDGRVYSLKQNIWLKPEIDKDGYYRYGLSFQGKIIHRLAHRLVWEAWVGEIPKEKQIDHINTIRTDNNLENLRCVTPKENANNLLTKQHSKERWTVSRKQQAKERTQNNWKNNPKMQYRQIKISIDDRIYNSFAEAVRKLKVSPQVIAYRCKSTTERWKNYKIIGSETI